MGTPLPPFPDLAGTMAAIAAMRRLMETGGDDLRWLAAALGVRPPQRPALQLVAVDGERI